MYQSNKFPVSTILIQTIKIKSSSSILKVLVAVWTMKYKKISSTFSLKHFFTSRVIDWIFFICRLYVSKQLTKLISVRNVFFYLWKCVASAQLSMHVLRKSFGYGISKKSFFFLNNFHLYSAAMRPSTLNLRHQQNHDVSRSFLR